ncbi:MAG: hypothetical protein QM713_08580 [Arachnia sp.]
MSDRVVPRRGTGELPIGAVGALRRGGVSRLLTHLPTDDGAGPPW